MAGGIGVEQMDFERKRLAGNMVFARYVKVELLELEGLTGDRELAASLKFTCTVAVEDLRPPAS